MLIEGLNAGHSNGEGEIKIIFIKILPFTTRKYKKLWNKGLCFLDTFKFYGFCTKHYTYKCLSW